MRRKMVVTERVLDEHVANTSEGIAQVNPSKADRSMVGPGIAQSFSCETRVFDTSSDAWKEPFLCLAIKVAVVQHEFVCTAGDHGEENFTVTIDSAIGRKLDGSDGSPFL